MNHLKKKNQNKLVKSKKIIVAIFYTVMTCHLKKGFRLKTWFLKQLLNNEERNSQP